MPGQQIAFQHQGPPYCLYPNDPNRACIKIAPDEWITITTHIEVGTWNTPSSRIRTYYARTGQASTLIADSNDAYPNKTFEIDNTCGRSAACAAAGLPDTGSGTWPNAKFGKIWLMSYMTGRDPNKNGGAAQASALWIDDLIVSRQPIADPGSGTTTQLQPPAAPTGLLLQ